MKFVHIADLHFDTPFVNLSGKLNLIEQRKLEQRNILKKVITYIQENNIEYLFISGDLYENEHVKKSTIEYINSLFKSIPDTKVFISPGNHDPNIKGSYYDAFEFAENVKIFKTPEIEKVEDENAEFYGLGFNSFYMKEVNIYGLDLKKGNKPKILIMHADLNGNKDENGFVYNPVSENKLNQYGFDYIALGHIHKTNFDQNEKIVYPGSLLSLGFDELGKHGMIVGEIEDGKLKKEFIPLDNREFIEFEINVENMYSNSDLVDYINSIVLADNELCKVILRGNRNFIININEISKFISKENIIKIKDETKLGYDIEELAKENTLKGIFIRKILEKYNEYEFTEEEIEKAIEIGLEAME